MSLWWLFSRFYTCLDYGKGVLKQLQIGKLRVKEESGLRASLDEQTLQILEGLTVQIMLGVKEESVKGEFILFTQGVSALLLEIRYTM